MKYYNTIFILFLILIYANTLPAQSKDNSKKSLPEVGILGTQMLKLHSAIVDQDYDLYINLPRDYNDTTKTFPVLYVLDGQWDFPLASSLYGEQYYDGFVPSMVIVGITWGGVNPNYDTLRARDFTPPMTKKTPQFGNAPKFLQFIKEELIPFIETKYRVNNDRALMGSSLGGLFTLYTLFNETDLFNKYILTSPALTWDDGIIYKYEKKYSEKNNDMPVRLFMGIGQYENVETLKKFADTLRSRNYKNLKMQVKVVEGVGHSGAKAGGFTSGMQFAYEKPSLKVDLSILRQYAGNYEVAPNIVVKIDVEDNNLVAYIPDGTKIILYMQTDKDFYAKGFYLLGHFVKDKNGKVTGINLEQYNGKMFLKKL